MGPVVGRITDFVTLPNGERKSFLYLHEIFERTGADRWISQLRVSQERDDLIIFTVVPREEISPERKEMVENALRRGLDGADAELRIVKEILPDKSGKTARII
jgi:isochorismate hydrolase